MRLTALETDHGWREKALMFAMRLMSGQPVPDVVRTLLYRREFWGDPYNQIIQRVMRGPSDWSVGERELFAAFVSRLNQCRF